MGSQHGSPGAVLEDVLRHVELFGLGEHCLRGCTDGERPYQALLRTQLLSLHTTSRVMNRHQTGSPRWVTSTKPLEVCMQLEHLGTVITVLSIGRGGHEGVPAPKGAVLRSPPGRSSSALSAGWSVDRHVLSSSRRALKPAGSQRMVWKRPYAPALQAMHSSAHPVTSGLNSCHSRRMISLYGLYSSLAVQPTGLCPAFLCDLLSRGLSPESILV